MLPWVITRILITSCPSLPGCVNCTYNSICLCRKEICWALLLQVKKNALKMKLKTCTRLFVLHAAGSYHFHVCLCSWQLQPGACWDWSPAQLSSLGASKILLLLFETLGISGNPGKLCTSGKRSETIYVLFFLLFEKSIIYLSCSVTDKSRNHSDLCL